MAQLVRTLVRLRQIRPSFYLIAGSLVPQAYDMMRS